MAYRSDNILSQNIEQLEQCAHSINPHSKVTFIIHGESVGEFMDAQKRVAHLNVLRAITSVDEQPIKFNEQEGYFYFEYKYRHVTIRVASPKKI